MAFQAFREQLIKELGAHVSLSKAAGAAIRRGLPPVESPPKPKRERQCRGVTRAIVQPPEEKKR